MKTPPASLLCLAIPIIGSVRFALARWVHTVAAALVWLAFCVLATPTSAQTAGSLDTTFKPNANNTVSSLAVQPNGQIVAGGYFTTMGGTTRNHIARISSTGALDTTFNPNANANVSFMAVQGDGKLVITDNFTTLQPNGAASATTRNHIARLTSTDGISSSGALETAFNPNANDTVRCLALQADGKMIIAGPFTTIGGVARSRIARLNASGTLDTAFTTSLNDYPNCVAMQLDGKILLGGPFTAVNGVTRNHFARLNADGTLDTSFNPSANGDPFCMIVQPDGKIITGGTFTSIGSYARNRMARLNADGSVDSAFDPNVDAAVFTMTLQANGKILIGGDLTTVGGVTRNHAARLNTDGSLDSFNPNANAWVYTLSLQADGKVLLGGGFSTVGGLAQGAPARLFNDSATQSLTVPSTARVQWLRGGASPEAQQVTFELSTNGGSTWTALGAGTRITGGWELTGLGLPATGQIRGRARTLGGIFTGTAGLVESVASYTSYFVTPTAGANGNISPNSIQSVGSGGSVSFTATPNTGYVVNQWLVDSSVFQTGGNTCTLSNVTANKTIQVTFTPAPYKVTPSAGANGSISPNSAQSVSSGGSVSFTATPNTGYVVNQWLVDSSVFQTGGSTCTLSNVTANKTIQVTFTPVTFTVSPSAGANGSISPNSVQTVSSGGSASFTATPNSGYMVNQWLVGGIVSQTGGNSYTVGNVTANVAVQVTFKFVPVVTVTPNAGLNGTISPNTAQSVASGSNASFTAIPNSGYLVDQWFVNGSAVKSGGTDYTLSNVTVNTFIRVTFRRADGLREPFPGVPYLDVALQVGGKGSLRPVLAARGRSTGQMMIVKGVYSRKVGVPIRVHTLFFVDPANPENAIRVLYSPKGDPVRITVAGQGRVDFTMLRKTGTLRAILRDKKGKIIMKDDNFATLTQSVGALRTSRAAVVYHSPYFVGLEDSPTPDEIAQGSTPEAAGPISEFLDFLRRSAKTYIQKVAQAAVTRGAPLGAVLQTWFTGARDLMMEEQPKVIRIVHGLYELTEDVKSIATYVVHPTEENFLEAAQAVDDIGEKVSEALGGETNLVNSQSQVAARDDGSTDPPLSTDQERSQYVSRRTGTASIVLNGIQDCYWMSDTLALSKRLLKVVVVEDTNYFRSMSSLVDWGVDLANVTATIGLGTSYRQSAYDAVSSLKLALVQKVAAQVNKAGEELQKQREGKTVNDQNIATLAADIQILESSGQAKPAQIAALREGLNDLIALGPVIDQNVTSCLNILSDLGTLNAQIRKIDLSSL